MFFTPPKGFFETLFVLALIGMFVLACGLLWLIYHASRAILIYVGVL